MNSIESFIQALKHRSDTWMSAAACQGLWEYFDFDRYERESDIARTELNMLRRICDSCPVKAECLEDTLLFSDTYTFRAGMTPRERKDLMAKLDIPTWERKQYYLRGGE